MNFADARLLREKRSAAEDFPGAWRYLGHARVGNSEGLRGMLIIFPYLYLIVLIRDTAHDQAQG